MVEINIHEINETLFQVTVLAQTNTTHQVSVQTDYALKLSNGRMTTIELIKKSFQFLLAREPNTSILRSFDLKVIAHYFPEYEREISQ